MQASSEQLPREYGAFRNAKLCICSTSGLRQVLKCPIENCETQETLDVSRPSECCPLHSPILTFCGAAEWICEKCREQGWYSTAGQGGPTEHVNELTKERYTPKLF